MVKKKGNNYKERTRWSKEKFKNKDLIDEANRLLRTYDEAEIQPDYFRDNLGEMANIRILAGNLMKEAIKKGIFMKL